MAGSDRSSTDSLLIGALAGGALVAEAAKRAGISERTAYRRLQDQRFRERVTEVRAEVFARTMARLVAAGTEAVDVLVELARRGDSDHVRLGAAKTLIELGTR